MDKATPHPEDVPGFDPAGQVVRSDPGTEARKETKPLGSLVKSPTFERYYAAFVAEVFANDVRTIATGETSRYRWVLLAGYVQMRVDKVTRLLSFHHRRKSGGWNARPLQHFKLLQNINGWHEIMIVAWAARMRSTVPKSLPAGERWMEPGHPYESSNSLPDGPELKRDVDAFLRSACVSAGSRRVPQRLKSVLGAMLARAIWRHLLDPNVVKLTTAIFGPHARTSDYNLVATHFEHCSARVLETPNLAPVLGPYLLQMSSASDSPPDWVSQPDLLNRARAYLLERYCSPAANAKHAAVWPAAWRFLARSPRSLVQVIVREGFRDADDEGIPQDARARRMEFRDDERTSVLATVIALGQARPESKTAGKVTPHVPVRFVRWLLRLKHDEIGRDMRELGDETVLPPIVRILTAQAHVARRRGLLNAFIDGDLVLVWDYLNRERAIPGSRGRTLRSALNPIAKNATWASLLRNQRTWHLTRAIEREKAEAERRARDEAEYARWCIERAEKRALVWQPVLSSCVIDDCVVTALTSGNELIDESEEMNHCVDEDRFMLACHAGQARLFHLRAGEERSTLLIVRRSTESPRWEFGQHFAVDNQVVHPLLKVMARKVLARFQQAYTEQAVTKTARQGAMAI